MNTNPAVVEDLRRFVDACATDCFVNEAFVTIHELPSAGHNSMIARPHRNSA
jgi:hypothetical protein